MTSTTINEGPRITPEIIEEMITSEHYFTAWDGVCGNTDYPMPENLARDAGGPLSLLTMCVLVLQNGYTILGKSACASPSNFSQTIGEKVAREDAIRQVWPLLGYELRSRLYNATRFGDDDLGEALTRMTAHRLGNPEAFRAQDADVILDKLVEDEGETGGHTSFADQLRK
jgi:hypothetical protein